MGGGFGGRKEGQGGVSSPKGDHSSRGRTEGMRVRTGGETEESTTGGRTSRVTTSNDRVVYVRVGRNF